MVSCGHPEGIRSGKTLNTTDIPLEKKYQKIIIQKFEIDPNLEKDYPEAANACESTAMEELLRKSSILRIVKVRTSTSREAGALIIKTKITALKIVSSASPGGAGALSGSSEMTVNLKLIDAESGYAVREKNISLAKNAYVPSSKGGNSGHSPPHDLGRAVAKYIAEVVNFP
jgi:hypothetical protein